MVLNNSSVTCKYIMLACKLSRLLMHVKIVSFAFSNSVKKLKMLNLNLLITLV
ncbi:hypothetical protein D3C72_2034460 [compost metagenome]